MEDFLCNQCKGTETKEGKLFGVAGIHPMDAKHGLGGSDVIIRFCAKCGMVLNMQVKNPESLK